MRSEFQEMNNSHFNLIFFGFLSLRPLRTLRVPFSCLFAFALFVYIGLCFINILYSHDLLCCLSFIIYITFTGLIVDL